LSERVVAKLDWDGLRFGGLVWLGLVCYPQLEKTRRRRGPPNAGVTSELARA
jgi:hypothetical protein